MVAMPTDPKYRLRRKDDKPDKRTKTYETKAEAEAARASLPPSSASHWEIVQQWSGTTSGPSGPSTPPALRKKKVRGISLDDETWALIGRTAKVLDTSRTGVVEVAVEELAKRKKIT